MEDIGMVNRKNQFTLIELLTVIAIISILMALLLPALKMAKQFANNIVCVNNHKQLGLAVQVYAGDYDGYPGYWLRTPNPDPSKPDLTPYRSIWYKKDKGSPWQDYFPITQDPPPILRCPSGDNGKINIHWHINASADDYSNDTLLTKARMQNQQIFGRKLENMTIFADGRWSKSTKEVWIHTNNKTDGFDRFRHFGKQFNSAFLDGHVSPIPYTAYPTSGKRDWTDAIGWPGH